MLGCSGLLSIPGHVVGVSRRRRREVRFIPGIVNLTRLQYQIEVETSICFLMATNQDERSKGYLVAKTLRAKTCLFSIETAPQQILRMRCKVDRSLEASRDDQHFADTTCVLQSPAGSADCSHVLSQFG